MLRTCWSAIVAAAADGRPKPPVATSWWRTIAPKRSTPFGAVDAAQLLDAAQVDQQRGRRQPQLHQRDQRVPAGEDLGLLAAVGERSQRLVERPGRHVVELSGDQDFASWIVFPDPHRD